MTNRNKKSEKPISQKDLDALWLGAMADVKETASKAANLLAEGYRPLAQITEEAGIAYGSSNMLKIRLIRSGWSCVKAQYEGHPCNFLRPPLNP